MTLTKIIERLLNQILDPLVAILIGLALIMFFWGLVKYLQSGLGDKAKLEEAKKLMVWGVVVLFVMVSVWGLVRIVQGVFFDGASPTSPPAIPLFNQNNAGAGN